MTKKTKQTVDPHPPGEPWWKEISERHAQIRARQLSRYPYRAEGGELGFKSEGPNIFDDNDNGYDPNLVTGRCRCKACQAAREHSSQ